MTTRTVRLVRAAATVFLGSLIVPTGIGILFVSHQVGTAVWNEAGIVPAVISVLAVWAVLMVSLPRIAQALGRALARRAPVRRFLETRP